MKNAKKMLIGMLVIVILLMLFPGCRNTQNPADGGSNGKKTVISFAGWGSLAEKKVFTAMIDQFEKKHEGVKVNYQHIPGTQADYLVKLISLLASHKMPDVFYIHSDEFYSWVDAGRLENLTPYFEKSQTASETKVWDKSLNIFRYNSSAKQIGTEDGNLYGLPKDLGPWAMVYNKTLFQAKGVPLPDPKVPMTWSQFVNVCKKLTG